MNISKSNQLTYLEKKARAKEIINCPYCEMKSTRNALKKHVILKHNQYITTNYINQLGRILPFIN